MGSGIGQFPFEAMAEEEPDYASLQSRGGPPSEEAPHPFWSERVQDEFRLQQARPRELDRLANRNYQDGENTLGMEGPQGQEPPYGSPGMRSAHDGLIREAVEDVLAENEALRRRVTDLENFSSARTGSTRQYQSTTSRSVELRSPEPDYSALDQLAEEDGFQRGQAMEQEQSIGNRPVSMQESSQPRSLFSGLMERTRTGSAERWNALRNFLRFQPREAEMASRPQGFQQTVSRLEEMSSQLYRDRSPGRPGNSWERISSSVPRRDPIAEVGVAGNSLQISGLESASMSRPQWSTMQVGSTPPTNQVMTPRAGLAHARDQSLLFGFPPPPSFPDVRSSMPTSSNRLAHRPVLQSQVVSETRLGRQDQGIEASNVRVGNGCGEGHSGVAGGGLTQQGAVRGYAAEAYANQQRGPSSLGAEPKPAAGDGRGRDPFITDLIELSPPRVEGMVQQSARLDSAPLSAWQNPLFQPADGQRVTELLRGYNVDEGTGLRGVQLAQPRREREPIPVIHMPEREYGALSEQAPPPSLDLLGLDPVPIQQYLAEHPQIGHKPPAALTPCMPGALSPFVPVVGAGSLPVAPQPPGPPGPFESPRSGQNTARSVYTPGGTRVPDGPPPVTPRVSFSPTVDYTHVEGADSLPVYPSGETQGNGASTQPTISPSMIPPAPPMAPMVLPPPMAPGLGGCAPHVGPPLVGGPGPRVEEPSRLVYHLPPLSVEPGTQDASVAAGDWVARVRPVLTTLSPSAHRWWESTHKTAVEFYQRWLIGEPSERLRVRSEVEAYRVDWSYLSLVNERGGVLILGALTPDLQTECVTTRMLSAVGLLFTIFVRYQPGGPSEKAAVLSFLSNPSSPASLSDAQSSLRRWLRLYNRTAELNLHYPDPSLLVKGLDRLGHHISKSSNAGFRLASYRHAQRLDYEPTQHTVLAFAQVLLGEVEQQLLMLDLSQAEKKARISKAQAQEKERDDPPPKAKGPPPNKEGMRSTAAKAKPKARIVGQEEEVATPPCRFFMSPSGCRYGKSCNQQHPEIRKGEGRCYECGATTHLRPQCPRKEGPEESPKRAQRMKRLATRDAGSVGPEPESEVSPPSTHGQVSDRLTSQEAPQAKAPPQGYGPKISRLSLSEPLGLLDGGATHALRPADDAEEYSKATPLKVGLATGETDDLRINKGGTLLSLDRETQPILPLGVAVRLLGMSVVWRENHCDIVHPIRGRIKVFLQRGCPEVPRALCIALIRELELKLQGNGTPSKSLQAVDAVDRCETSQRLSAALKSSNVLEALREWMKDAYPSVPDPLLDKVVPSRFLKPEDCSFNRHTRRKVERGKVLLHLFSGSQSWSHPSYNCTLNIEKERGWDLLDDSTFGYLLESAMKGCIAGIVAGPPCRTWSRLRSSSDNGPPPLRAREGVCRFGYTDLDPSYKEVVDGDTCLLLRSLFLVEVMQAARQALAFQPGFVFLEHPADPMTYMECRHPASRQSVELSVPQPFTTLSTCEAELVSSCEALTLSQAVIPLWREMLGVPTRWVTITDSVSAAAVLLYPAGSWRTRHLRLRCRVFQEYIEQELLVLAHVKGQFQLADLLTKALTPPRIKQLLHYLDVDLGTLNEKVNAEEGVSGTQQAPKAVKALFVLSCLMNPVRAQPNSDLREVSSAWFWAMWIVAACCVAGFVALFLQWDRCRRQRRSKDMGLKQGLAEVEEFVAAEREEVLEASKPKGVPPCLVLLCKAPTVKAPPPRLSDAAETRTPVRPVKRPPPFMLSAHAMPIRSVPKPTPERGRASYTEVETPPRQHSSELPALLSYEELIARSLRRELSREPTSAEVEREIFLMRLRHQGSRSRSSRGSETDTESSSDSTVSSGIQDPTATGSSQPFPSAPSLSPGQATAKVPSSRFQYLEPAPTPVIRILGSRVDEEGNTIHEAVRVDGGSPVPVDLYSRPHRMSSSSPPPSHQGMSEISSGSDQNTGITTSINEPPNDAPVSDAVEAEESTSEEAGASEYSELDVQIAEATLLLQQNTDVQFAVGLGHLSETQRALYRRIVARQRRGLEEVD